MVRLGHKVLVNCRRSDIENNKPVWVSNGKTVRHVGSDVDALRDGKGRLNLNTKTLHFAVDLCMAQQKLHGAKVARLRQISVAFVRRGE